MAKAGKSWFHNKWHDGSRSEYLRWYYSGNTRKLQRKYSGRVSKSWHSTGSVIYAGKATTQRKKGGRWTDVLSKSDRSTIRYIKKKHGIR